MKNIFYRVSFLWIIIFCDFAYSQEYTYESYNASNGLPTSEIISLYKDYKGFLWVGTTLGVSRYDGYSFENFQTSADGHFIGNVTCIKEGTNKRLWIGSYTGLFYLENNIVYKVNEDNAVAQGVNDIMPEPDGGMWLATENGPAYISAKEIYNSKKQPINLREKIIPGWQQHVLSKDKLRATKVSKAPDGTIYFCNFYEIFRYEKTKVIPIFSRYDVETNFTILSIFPISEQKIYFNEAKLGMHKIENGQVTRIPFNKLYQPHVLPASKAVWYSGMPGFFKFYPNEEVVNFYFNTFDIDVIWLSDMLYDDNDFYWVASHDGLIKIKPAVFKKYPLKTFYNVQEVYSFKETADGKFLLGANRGKLYVQEKDSFRFFFPDQQRIVPFAEIFSIYEDSRKWLWFGTGYQGIAVYRNGKITRYKIEDGLHDNSIKYFLKTANGKFYGIGDQGLTEIIVDKDSVISFKSYSIQKKISQYGGYFSAIEGPDHTIWLGGEEGIACLKNDSLVRFLLDGKEFYVGDIKKDGAGNVWITTGGEGLLRCGFTEDNQLVVKQKYNERNGLNTSTFISILPARDGNIWVSSPRGISFIGLTGSNKGQVQNFDEKDGFIKSGYNNLTLYQDKKGVIWAGCSKGFTSFNPDSIIVSAPPPKIYITGVNLLNSKENIVQFADGVKDNVPVRLSLPHNKNSILISYTSIAFQNSNALRYFYKLIGVDTGWIYGRNSRTVNYLSLKPGTYQFRVKSINDKFLWSEQDATVDFIIKPPFWKTWWFITLCFVTLSAIGYRAYLFIRQKYDTQKTLNSFVTSLYGKNTPEEIFRSIAINCINQLGFTDCVLYQVDPERGILVQKAAAGPKSYGGNEIVNPIEIPIGKGIVGAVAGTAKAEIIHNTSIDSRYILDDARRLSEITVPIIVDGDVFGVIDSEHPRRRFYKKYHLYILQTIAGICATRISKYLTEEKLRSNIARDLHDDMGSTLSSINIISKMALQNKNTDLYMKEYLQKIKENSGRMLESMSDIVWAINPGNDTVEKLVLRMKEFTAEILEPLNIIYSFAEEGDFGNIYLNLSRRKDFYLVFKEAINNVAKYSQCSTVRIELKRDTESFSLLVKDNGAGFDESKIKKGNGLTNMHSRAAAMNGLLKIETEIGAGVSIYLKVPVEKNLSIT